MDGNFDDVAIHLQKQSPAEHGLRKYLTDKKPATSVRQLMD